MPEKENKLPRRVVLSVAEVKFRPTGFGALCGSYLTGIWIYESGVR